jgi:DNA anti-recombination protein RmuC
MTIEHNTKTKMIVVERTTNGSVNSSEPVLLSLSINAIDLQLRRNRVKRHAKQISLSFSTS